MIGPAVPVPVSQEVLNALISVEVTHASQGPNLFQLQFELSRRSILHTLFLVSGGAQIPLIRVVLIVTLNGTPEVLMDGVMTQHEVTPGGSAGQPVLTITGEDLSRVMDYISFTGIPYPAMPAEARVALIVAKYAMFGVVPLVIPSVLIDVPIPTGRIPKHIGTDLKYVQKLAGEVGYKFYVEPGPKPGMSIAYWGPEIRVTQPQPALNINMDLHTNVESMSFQYNPHSRTLPLVWVQESITKAPVPLPIPDITPLSPPLGIIPSIPKQFYSITGTGKYSFPKAIMIGLAKAGQSAQDVSVRGSLDVLRYGNILKARRLVGVRGAGLAFDGLYYVTQVTHQIKRAEYKQSFQLTRNGLISTVPRVLA